MEFHFLPLAERQCFHNHNPLPKHYNHLPVKEKHLKFNHINEIFNQDKKTIFEGFHEMLDLNIKNITLSYNFLEF